ncbi:MAG: DNA-directed RNA polymerase subunit beta' [Firmicutes bacterium]|nr:DNA-directed RNA polymerase subunit beta' [Bacillota bacterium]
MAVKTNHQQIQFDAIKIGLASPEKIHEWSHGEVKKPETINYRTLKPERDGLFCERIFGPTKDWECHCGKYKRIRYKGVICDRCGVEVTKAKVRRERMGHIELACPVSHIWYFKGIPSRMGLILDIPPRALEKVLYFASYVVLDGGDTGLIYKQLLSENEYREAEEKYGDTFRVGMGAEAVKELLESIDLEKLDNDLKKELENANGQKRMRIIKRLEVVEAFLKSGNKPEWMIMDVVPVIPPDIRAMVPLDGGRFATSDLNDLYRRVINRNNRLRRLLSLGAPDIIVRNEKRMLQEAVDALIDNGRRGRPVTGPGNRALKSLSDMLRGKQGRFRQNLLGKRVDYSGRSVIVVGPELKFYQCGLPKEMAIELFKPFVMKKLVEKELAHNIKSAKRMVERLQGEVWDVLEEVIREHPVMLNRAPTLHRLGIQAFEPILVEGKAIKLHPLVCAPFNADFDGDQMAVHVPLSIEAQTECRFMLLSTNNLLKPSDGGVVTVPSQDMVLGMYYLTIEKPDDIGSDRVFKDPSEAIAAQFNGELTLHSRIKVRRTLEVNGQTVSGIVETTVGRIILNEKIPQDLGYVERDPSRPETYLPYEINFLVGKKQVKPILQRSIDIHGITYTIDILDSIKSLGYKYSTMSGISISVADVIIPEQKQELIEKTEEVVAKLRRQYQRGLLTSEERSKRVIEEWTDTINKVTGMLLPGMGEDNNIYMMIESGARGSLDQLKQLAAMRGLMASPSGGIIELPIKSCLAEGLDVQEYFISAHGTRKGLTDTALRTADSGYLTRRLVDVSQNMIVRDEDCCPNGGAKGMWVQAYKGYEITQNGDKQERHETIIESLEERIKGRWAVDDVKDPLTGEVIVPADTMITPAQAARITSCGIETVHIRTVFTCQARSGVCAKCYGADMSTGLPVRVGEAVGIIAAQSIGEPGTQLTMRTFHAGGIANASDITQGLPRVQELFEARKPKGLAVIAEFGGIVEDNTSRKKREIIITNPDTKESKNYLIPYGAVLRVTDGQTIEAGDTLTEGSVDPHDILRIKGILAVQDYLIQEVQRVYRSQGVDINDKHVEIIVRQMLRKIRIEDNGDTDMLPGSLVDVMEYNEKNRIAEEEGLEKATGERILLGITKSSLATDSFLSAASFQETTRVLTEAAIKGKIDPLEGLKENVIIGKLIPAGTGMDQYQNAEYVLNGSSEEQPAEPVKEGPAHETVYEEEEESTLDLAGVLDELLAASDDSEDDE